MTRCPRAKLVTLVLAGLVSSSLVLAHRSPPDCNGNNFNLNIAREKIAVVRGETNTYSVTAFNNVGLLGGCDLDSLEVVFFCPDANGSPSGAMTLLSGDGGDDLPANPPLGTIIQYPPVVCAFDINPGVNFADVQALAGDRFHNPPSDLSKGTFHDTVDGTALLFGKLLRTEVEECDFGCQTADLEVIKVCDSTDPFGENHFSITLTNIGTADLMDCAVLDQIFLDDPDCPADVGAALTVPTFPGSVGVLPAGSTANVTGTVTGLVADACNEVSVTCAISGTEGENLSVSADDICEAGQGCLTRGAEFWGHYPEVARRFLSGRSCGLPLNNVFPHTDGSALEDLCFNARDFKSADTSPQQLQLIRQCTAMSLNLAATAEGGGSCEGSYPGINGVYASCCEALCTQGADRSSIENSMCVEMLDAFNHVEDTMEAFGPLLGPGSANTTSCRDARGNGFVNPGRDLGPRD